MVSSFCKSLTLSASSWTVLYVSFALLLLKLDSVTSLRVQLSRQSSISNKPSKVFRDVDDLTNLKFKRNRFIATRRQGRQITACNMLENLHEVSDVLSTLHTFLSESLVLRNIDLGDITVSGLNAVESATHTGITHIPAESLGAIGEGSLTSITTAAAGSIDFNAIFSKAATTGKAGKKYDKLHS